jgi:flagellar biosynthesis/type III secretory pathway protein FliH
MYDQREKAQRDYQWALDSAREEGREEGLERGREEGLERGREQGLEAGRQEGMETGALVGKIQLLQQLLGEASCSTADLRQRSLEELNSLQTEVQQRLRSRENG